MMLCSACTALFQGHDAPWYYIRERDRSIPAYHHHPSPAQLARAARDGCHICTIIWRKLAVDERTVLLNTWGNPWVHRASQAFQRVWGVSIAYYSWSPIWWSVDDFGIRFQFGDAPFWKTIIFRLLPVTEQCPEDDDPTARFTTEMVASPTSPTQWPEPFRKSEDHAHLHTHSMWSPHTQRLLQRWYTECVNNHEVCKNKDGRHGNDDRQRHDFQPTRILDLSDGKIKLDISPLEREGQSYASLTHRWSLHPETMPRLNPGVLPQWCENIDPSILTPTFRDAVDVARKLQIRYLWIDSLCILQTGTGWAEDWQKESAVMGEVYRHAFLNIQAGRDAEALELGMFRAPTDRDIDPFRVNISRKIVKARIRGRPASSPISIEGSFSIVEEDFARDELLGNPINRRGWVLQERLLSHRITHFGAQQVFWECRQLLACETFPEGLPKTIPKTLARAATAVVRNPTFDPKSIVQTIKRRMTANLNQESTPVLVPLSPVTAAKAIITTPIDPRLPVPSFPSLTVHRDLFAWFYLAELYSACSLTRETDKLVAISGLAQIFGSPAFHDRAADVVAYLRNLALPRSGGAVTDLQLDLDATSFDDTDGPLTNGNRGRPGFAHHHRPSKHLLSHHAHIGNRPTGDYLAGLWRYELIPCLLWHVANGRQHNGTPSRRIAPQQSASSHPGAEASVGRAPSWSWASVNGLLHASVYQNWSMGIDGVVLAEVSGAKTEKSFDQNSWGGVVGGKIVLAAKCVYQKDIVWPGVEEVEDLMGKERVRAHMSVVHAGMTRRIKLNSASVARLRVLKADVLGFVDDMREFSGALRRAAFSGGSGGGNGMAKVKYQVALVPLIGLQRRRADWSKIEGYTDEVFEWHGLIVGLSRRGASRGVSPRGSQVDLLANSLSAGLAMGAVGAAMAPGLLGTDGGTVGGVFGERKRKMGDDADYVAERLGYFRCRDTEVFRHTLERKGEVEIMIV
jgi:Heterokaryon incompatibility protein (HET)